MIRGIFRFFIVDCFRCAGGKILSGTKCKLPEQFTASSFLFIMTERNTFAGSCLIFPRNEISSSINRAFIKLLSVWLLLFIADRIARCIRTTKMARAANTNLPLLNIVLPVALAFRCRGGGDSNLLLEIRRVMGLICVQQSVAHRLRDQGCFIDDSGENPNMTTKS